MRYNFNLRPLKKGQSKKDARLIYFVCYFISNGNKKKFTYSTGFKIPPQYWNVKEQRVKNVLAAENSQTINNYLNELSTAVNNWTTEQTAQRQTVTPEALKLFLDKWNGKVKAPETKTKDLLVFVENFIKESETRINPNTRAKIAHRTVQKYNIVFNHLKEFAENQKRKTFFFQDIDINFYNLFVSFLTSAKEMKPNSVGKSIAVLKVFLNDAERLGFDVLTAHKTRYFKVFSEDVQKVYLNEKELQIIQNLDLSKKPRLDKVRDLFLIGCWTGLRFSDFTEISPNNIKTSENGAFYIELKQQKTGANVVIPCQSVVMDILNKYKHILPKPISNQRFNDYLKELCQLAEINQTIELTETKGGKKQTRICEKWELVKTHTARRSFATNLYKRGVQSKTIMQITGHKTETSFYKYIVLDSSEHAEILRQSIDNPQKAVLRVVA